MPYISLDNLTQYNGRLRDYIDGSFDKLDGANWRKTSATQSVSCWPIPESPLEPEVTFKFSETQPESGTKGPDNPSTIVGVESVSCNVCESEGVDDTPYSIDLGGTYYGGTVNFATGVMEVDRGYAVFDGSEPWFNSEYSVSGEKTMFQLNTLAPSVLRNTDSVVCTHFTFRTGSSTLSDQCNKWDSGPFFIALEGDVSVSDFTSWLSAQKNAGTPVAVVYQLATPYTVPLTPVLVRSLPALSHYVPRQNTIYTPHESVQVGYAKSASKTSQDLANAIVALGGNI